MESDERYLIGGKGPYFCMPRSIYIETYQLLTKTKMDLTLGIKSCLRSKMMRASFFNGQTMYA